MVGPFSFLRSGKSGIRWRGAECNKYLIKQEGHLTALSSSSHSIIWNLSPWNEQLYGLRHYVFKWKTVELNWILAQEHIRTYLNLQLTIALLLSHPKLIPQCNSSVHCTYSPIEPLSSPPTPAKGYRGIWERERESEKRDRKENRDVSDISIEYHYSVNNSWTISIWIRKRASISTLSRRAMRRSSSF